MIILRALAYCRTSKAYIMQMGQKICNVTFNAITHENDLTIYNPDKNCIPSEVKDIVEHCEIIEPLTHCSALSIKKTHEPCKKFIFSKFFCERSLTIEDPYKYRDFLKNIITTIKQIFQLNCDKTKAIFQSVHDKISPFFEKMTNTDEIINDESLNDAFDYHAEAENYIFNVTDVPVVTTTESIEPNYQLYALLSCIISGSMFIGIFILIKRNLSKHQFVASHSFEEMELNNMGAAGNIEEI